MEQQTEAGRPREAETTKQVVDDKQANLGVINAPLQLLSDVPAPDAVFVF